MEFILFFPEISLLYGFTTNFTCDDGDCLILFCSWYTGNNNKSSIGDYTDKRLCEFGNMRSEKSVSNRKMLKVA